MTVYEPTNIEEKKIQQEGSSFSTDIRAIASLTCSVRHGYLPASLTISKWCVWCKGGRVWSWAEVSVLWRWVEIQADD